MHGGLEYRARWESRGIPPDGHNAQPPWILTQSVSLPWRSGVNHIQGAIVTYQGNTFIAKYDTTDTPDPNNPHGGWALQ